MWELRLYALLGFRRLKLEWKLPNMSVASTSLEVLLIRLTVLSWPMAKVWWSCEYDIIGWVLNGRVIIIAESNLKVSLFEFKEELSTGGKIELSIMNFGVSYQGKRNPNDSTEYNKNIWVQATISLLEFEKWKAFFMTNVLPLHIVLTFWEVYG